MAMHQYSSEHDPSEGSLLWPRSRMALFAQGTFAVLIILLTVALVDIARNDTYDESVVGADLALANQKIQGLPPVEPERVQVHGTCYLHAACCIDIARVPRSPSYRRMPTPPMCRWNSDRSACANQPR